MYGKIIEAYNKGEIDFSNVRTYNLDEYCGIDKNHEQSYSTFMYENLFKHINIDINNTHIPSGEGDFDEACEKYNLLLKYEKLLNNFSDNKPYLFFVLFFLLL